MSTSTASGEVARRSAGARTPGALGVLALMAASLGGAVGCGSDQEERALEPVQLGMTPAVPPIYESDEFSLYEVRLPVMLPLLRPTEAELDSLRAVRAPPFRRAPWVAQDQVQVRVSWTLSNLDEQDHAVEVLLDPWNEFGRYWPGLALVDAEDEEFLPNYSGIQLLLELPGVGSGRSPRVHGEFTREDMDEVATDFATAMNIIATVPPPEPGSEEMGPVTLVNHAFNIRNRSHSDVLTRRYVPAVIPGLVGFDLGLRTREPATIAFEAVIELVGPGDPSRVAKEGTAPERLMRVPQEFVTLAAMGGY